MLQINLKKLREEHNMSQSKLAKAIGVAQSTVGMWESGKNKPEYATLLKIAEVFNVSIDYLTGTDEPIKSNIRVEDENKNNIILDDEALELIDSLRSKPEMKMLFSVSKNATKEDIIKAVKIIEALKDNK